MKRTYQQHRFSFWEQNKYQNKFVHTVDPKYITNKVVLSIQCNEGFSQLSIAIKYFPKRIICIDCSQKNINKAKSQLQKFINNKKKQQKSLKQNQQSFEINSITQIPLYIETIFQNKFLCQSVIKKNIKFNFFKTNFQNQFPKNIQFKCLDLNDAICSDQFMTEHAGKIDTVIYLGLQEDKSQKNINDKLSRVKLLLRYFWCY